MISVQNYDSAFYNNKINIELRPAQSKRFKKIQNFGLMYYLGAISVVAVILVIVIVVQIQSRKDHIKLVVAPRPHQIFMKSGRHLWIFDEITNNLTFSKSAACDIRTYDVYMDNVIFISGDCSSTINSFSNTHSNLNHTSKWKPKIIALDFITDNMYVLDDITNSLNVIDKKDKNYAKILSDVQDFVLDPVEGILFYVIKSIWKSNIDGSAQKQLINDENITAITVDRDEKLLYWVRESRGIERSDYNGTSRTLLYSTVRYINSLAVLGDRLYLSVTMIEGVDLSSEYTLWSCQLQFKGPCTTMTGHRHPFGRFELLRVPTDRQKYIDVKPNPCSIDNGNCQHLCLLNASGDERRSCACNMGWRLNADFRTCSLASKVLVYINGDYVKMKYADDNRDDFDDDIVPTRLWSANNQIEDNGFDYDLLTGDFFFSYQCHIYKVNVKRDEEPKLLLRSPTDSCISDVVRDAEKGRLYYVMLGPSMHATITWSSLKADMMSEDRTTLVKLTYRKDKVHQNCMKSLLIHQSGEYIFYMDIESPRFNVRRVLADGTNSIMITELLYYDSPSLSVDYETNRLYWLYDKYDGIVKHANLDGTDVRLIKLLAIKGKTRLIVMGRWFYAGTGNQIWRFDKLNGGNLTKITDTQIDGDYKKIHGFKIFSRK